MLINNIKAALVKSFNKANKLKPYLQLSEVVWVNVEIWLQGDCNSRATVVALDSNNDYEGRREIYFNRRDIGKDLIGQVIPGKRSDYTGLKSVIKALHDKCGIPLDVADFLDLPLPVSGPVTIQPTTICMAYLPTSSVTLNFAET
ncbi:virion structural protein [Pseudomonas phage Phabio]|uniref:Virion structural protein n=1 Tax=Pseudomonas phage Phabio TaxID=2006668 RepID=A0A1Y0SZ88_9CAUD|nr:virion structural protein [Pseudomonas phage Phabio]ARV76829.1 virion structural protein [Pseudomonas phage Phabio]